MEFSKELKKKIKREFPFEKKLHDALDRNNNIFVYDFFRKLGPEKFMLDPNKILNLAIMGDLNEIKKIAGKAGYREKLRDEVFEEIKNITQTKNSNKISY